MKGRYYNEKNGLWYERKGDYYFPILNLPPARCYFRNICPNAQELSFRKEKADSLHITQTGQVNGISARCRRKSLRLRRYIDKANGSAGRRYRGAEGRRYDGMGEKAPLFNLR